MHNSRTDLPTLPRGRAATWTRERLDKLSTDELRTLLANAHTLNEPELAALCEQVLVGRKIRRRKSA